MNDDGEKGQRTRRKGIRKRTTKERKHESGTRKTGLLNTRTLLRSVQSESSLTRPSKKERSPLYPCIISFLRFMLVLFPFTKFEKFSPLAVFGSFFSSCLSSFSLLGPSRVPFLFFFYFFSKKLITLFVFGQPEFFSLFSPHFSLLPLQMAQRPDAANRFERLRSKLGQIQATKRRELLVESPRTTDSRRDSADLRQRLLSIPYWLISPRHSAQIPPEDFNPKLSPNTISCLDVTPKGLFFSFLFFLFSDLHFAFFSLFLSVRTFAFLLSLDFSSDED